MEVEHLLDEFPPISTELWEDVIHHDLKGADYAKRLIWQTPEGITVKPYYRHEDVASLHIDQASGGLPYLRSSRSAGNWRIREEIDADDPESANRDARSALAGGAEEISFTHVAVRNASDLGLLLVNAQAAPLHFANACETLIGLLCERLQGKPESQQISAGFDPLANPEFAASVVQSAPAGLVPFTINGEPFEKAGANAVQEVAFTLAAGIDFLADMEARGIEIDRAAALVGFSFSTGASYFFQIAKFRAFRMLWARAVESFGGSRETAKARIHARTSLWNKTIYDPHVNVLRATTEAMSAILGGADSVCVAPFDQCYRTPDEGSRRLARSTQIMLKHEALLAKVTDPGAGSYFLEALTDDLAREAWMTMQQIEADGGFQKANANGKLQHLLEESRKAREKSVISRRRVFTGTSQYANASEKALCRIKPSRIAENDRGAACYEQLRMRTERHAAETGKTPRVLLAEFGDVKMRAARSNFALNFFACAGFEIEMRRFNSADEIAAAAADLIVLCSSDAEYLEMATALALTLKSLHRKTQVIVAGNPDSAEQLRALGVADFIHIRSNPIEVLTGWQKRLGIEA
jgi:methylmalonyl-CoA mutase